MQSPHYILIPAVALRLMHWNLRAIGKTHGYRLGSLKGGLSIAHDRKIKQLLPSWNHFPLNIGVRRSTNAKAPSAWSAVPAARE